MPTTDLSLLKLMQLCGASLPIGAYAFSQGLEYAIESGAAKEQGYLKQWLQQVLLESIASTDLPTLIRLFDAFKAGDHEAADYWNAVALACRETKELYVTDTATGEALLRLLDKLGQLQREPHKQDISFVTAFAYAAVHWQIDQQSACLGFCWSWLENQVAAASKIVPLGQSSAQLLITELQLDIPMAIEKALAITDEQIGNSLPGLVMASSQHETQYSRLFRS